MKTDKRKTGDYGEFLARLYLFFHGYRILDRNYVYGKDELDIIACTYRQLAFVEVKTRRYQNKADYLNNPPRLAVDAEKMYHTRTCATHYLRNHPTNKAVRMDVIEVCLNKKGWHCFKIVHYKNAY